MRPDMLYGSKCCAMKKHVDQISVIETMFRQMSSKTRKEDIRDNLGLASIEDK